MDLLLVTDWLTGLALLAGGIIAGGGLVSAAALVAAGVTWFAANASEGGWVGAVLAHSVHLHRGLVVGAALALAATRPAYVGGSLAVLSTLLTPGRPEAAAWVWAAVVMTGAPSCWRRHHVRYAGGRAPR